MSAEKMKIEVEDLGTVKKKLSITIPEEVVAREKDLAYKKLRQTVALAGFRKGTVPISILKARFADRVREDVSTKLIEESYSQALREKELSPVASPKLDVATPGLEDGADFSYSVTMEVTPRVEVDGYMGMELKREPADVTEEDVTEALKKLRETHPLWNEVERPVTKGDLVAVDFEAFLDGKPLKGKKAEDYPVLVGEMAPMPGFDDAILGLSKGDRKDAPLKFPPNYHEKKLAGKEAVFSITVKSVKEKALHELDDEFAKALGAEDIDKLSEKVREELGSEKKRKAKEDLKNRILDAVIERHPFEVPDTLVERYLLVILNNLVENMRIGIVSPDDRGLSPDELKARYRDVARRRVKEDIVLDSIAAKEKVEVTEEEFEASVKELAASRGVPFELLMGRIQGEGTSELIRDGLKHEKVFDMIIAGSRPSGD